MTAVQHEWWGELRHGGMLVAPQFLDELVPQLPALDDTPTTGSARLASARRCALRSRRRPRRGAPAVRRPAARRVPRLAGWQKASPVATEFKATSVTARRSDPTGSSRPRRRGALLAVWFDGSDTVGRGRGVRAQASSSNCCARPASLSACLTNGRQFRLVHAGPDYDALGRVGRPDVVRRERRPRDPARLAALCRARPAGRSTGSAG